ncbi:MAG: protein kinase [Anaerolineales bacterium]|nr:protein kinase [Anaerolineales bacterium]
MLYNSTMPEWIGKTIGKVRIEKFLARGGMAEVYLGTHLTLERSVAVKVLHSFIEEDPGLLARFQREARVIAGLRHNNIVQILDFDAADGHPYIVMEYLAGPSLAAYLRNLHEHEARLAYHQVARLLKPLASALDYAHSQDIIHRDIKPANILLHSKGKASDFQIDSPLTEHVEPVITDFGLVRIAHSTTQTATGAVSGTPAYMSPEQARGDRVDYRTDIYSLGVVLYEMLAGRVPFESDSGMSVLFMHINEPPPPIQGIHPALQNVIQRVLAKKPDDRYQTCHELASDFTKAIEQSAQSETINKPIVPAPAAESQPEPIPDKRKFGKARNWKRILGFATGAFACICGLILAGVFSEGGWDAPPETELPITKPTVVSFIDTLFPTNEPEIVPIDFTLPADGSSVGVLRFQDGAAIANTVYVYTATMPPAPEGSRYQAWLMEDDAEQRISIGILRIGLDNKGAIIYWDEKGQNLIGKYSALEITLEPDPDPNPNPSNTVAYSVRLPEGGLTHVRHLLFSFGTTPNQIGFIHGLNKDTNLLAQSAEQMLAAFEEDDEDAVLLQAENMLNLIVGNQSEEYKDWNGNGKTDDPGDGYGLLLNGDHLGYIQGTFTHASLALTALDATPNMIANGDYVKVCANNVSDWTAQLRVQLIEMLKDPDSLDEEIVRQVTALAKQIRTGLDVNGNEKVEPIPGEGGARTAYEHAYYMADMFIPARGNQTPAP